MWRLGSSGLLGVVPRVTTLGLAGAGRDWGSSRCGAQARRGSYLRGCRCSGNAISSNPRRRRVPQASNITLRRACFQTQRKGKGKEQPDLMAYFGRMGPVRSEHEPSVGGLLGAGHGLPRPPSHCSKVEPTDSPPRICLGEPETRHQHVLVRQAGSRRLDTHLVFGLGKWNRTQEENPQLIDSSLRIVLMKAFLIELCNRLTITERGNDAGCQGHGMTDTGEWKTLKWDPTLREASGIFPDAPTKPTERLIQEATELRKTITAENLYRFLHLRASQGSPEFLGQESDRSLAPGSRGASLEHPERLDRICSPSHPWDAAFAKKGVDFLTRHRCCAGRIRLAAPSDACSSPSHLPCVYRSLNLMH